jgi:hypothetical protein
MVFNETHSCEGFDKEMLDEFLTISKFYKCQVSSRYKPI